MGDDEDLEPILKSESSEKDADIPQHIIVSGSSPRKVTKKAIFTLLIIVYINLLNYMDRFTVSSVLSDIKKWFNIQDKAAGLLQTVFVCSYMVFAPIFGYLGDRFSRKYVMAIGITIWTITTFAGSQMGQSQFYGFLALRGLVGVGEASYSTVAPTIIADLFIGDQRTKALTLFYFAIPCGSGLGYIAGSEVSALMNEWQWALRVTPALGIIAVILTIVGVHEPKRGALETAVGENDGIEDLSESVVVSGRSYMDDLKDILKVRSFNWATLGFTCVSFVVGALAWWAPSFALYAEQVHDGTKKRTIDQVSYIFGIITFVAGIVGVSFGAEWARRWRVTNMKADALVCGIGILLSTPPLFFALWSADKYIVLSWVLICLGEICMFFNWAPNGDILLYVIPPSCRATAEAIQILMIHVFGDAFSPFVVGAISDAYRNKSKDPVLMHKGLLYSLYITPFVCCIGAGFYFIAAQYLFEDKNKVDMMSRRTRFSSDDEVPQEVLGSSSMSKRLMTPPLTCSEGAKDNEGYESATKSKTPIESDENVIV